MNLLDTLDEEASSSTAAGDAAAAAAEPGFGATLPGQVVSSTAIPTI